MNWEEMLAGWKLLLLISVGFLPVVCRPRFGSGLGTSGGFWIRLATGNPSRTVPFTGGLAVSSGFFLSPLGGPPSRTWLRSPPAAHDGPVIWMTVMTFPLGQNCRTGRDRPSWWQGRGCGSIT